MRLHPGKAVRGGDQEVLLQGGEAREGGSMRQKVFHAVFVGLSCNYSLFSMY